MPGEPAEILSFQPPKDPQVQAAEILAKAITDATERFGPAADAVAGFSHRLDALCTFLKKRGPWVLASLPMVLVAVGAITPDTAKGLHHLLVAFGVAP